MSKTIKDTVAKGRSFNLRALPDGWQRTGYDFKGWGTSPAGPKVYDEQEQVTFVESTRLYAIWEKLELPDGVDYTEFVDGIQWTFKVVNGEAIVEKNNGQSTAIPSDTSGQVVVPSTLGGRTVVGIGAGAFEDCSSLTSVTIPDSVTSIGECAFFNCSGLASVTMGNGVTSIGSGAFYGCSGMTRVTIPDSVTSVGGGAFLGCEVLASVEFEGNAPTVGTDAFVGVASGCTAVISPTATGFPDAGQMWNGLIIVSQR